MKEYLDGKIKLKEPTLGDMCKVGGLIHRYGPDGLTAGVGLMELLGVVCIVEDGIRLEDQKPNLSKEILKDFFPYWKPLEWMNDNIDILLSSKKPSRKLPQGSTDIPKL